MNRLLTSLFGLALFLLAPGLALAQDGSVAGSVIDGETGEPLPGANVVVVELSTGAAADANGEFTIDEVAAGSYTLRTTFIGYEEDEQSVQVDGGETTTVNIELQPDLAGLEEVVVTGLASETSRANAEVATSSVDVSDLTDKASYTGVADLLAGKVAGLNVKQTSGNVGGGFRFDVRSGGGLGGSGQPVIYIDGVRVDNSETVGFGTGGQGISTLSGLNPEDISNIEVLKGPAGAALYGTSGSNGVVLITTKSGASTAQPFSVRYKTTIGANTQIKAYDFETSGTPDVANSFFEPGLINKQSISVSGGSDIVNYFGSYAFNDEEGAIPQNSQRLNSFRANFEALPYDNLTAKVTAGFSRNELIRPQNDNNIFGVLGNTLLSASPFVFADSSALTDIDNTARATDFSGSVSLNYDPVENLELRASGGYQANELRNDEIIRRGSGIYTVNNGARNIFERRNEQYTFDGSARYFYGITGDLRATTIVGAQLFNRTERTFNIQKQDFSTSLLVNASAGSEFIGGDSFFLQSREAGIFAQQELNYADTYLFTVGLRRDFATTIGSGASSIYYPKVSGAIRLEQLGFTPEYADLLKLRAAYGETGQLPDRLDALPFLFEAEPSAYGGGAVLGFVGNPDLKPERVREFEVGFDADLFGKLGLGFTYYRQNADDSIIGIERAPSTGIVSNDVPFNIGSVEGQGVEATADYTVFRSQSNTLSINANYAYQTNEVTDLGGAQPIRGGFDLSITDVGFPKAAFLGYTSEASFDENGEYAGAVLAPTSLDENGEPDREYLGTPVPAHTGSFGVNFRFLEDFNFYALADYAAGLSIFNSTRNFATDFGGNMRQSIALRRLGEDFEDFDPEVRPYLEDVSFGELEPGTDAYRAEAEVLARQATAAGGVATDGNFVEEADYLKLRELSLSYDISDVVNSLAGLDDYVERASIAFAARNILTFSKYGGIDPEINGTGARGQTRGRDFLTLAPPRTYTGTLTIRF